MTTAATRIRDAIFERLDPLTVAGGFNKVRLVPVALLQPDDLPAISIALLSERLTPNGDDNAGAPRFDSEVTIGISIVRGFQPAVALDAQVDADVDLIEQLLLCDPDFTRFGPDMRFAEGDPRREPFFEAVTSVNRRRSFPQKGESYLVEVRLEMTFRVPVDFEPLLPDDYKKLVLIARPLGTTQHTPQTGFQAVEITEEPTP